MPDVTWVSSTARPQTPIAAGASNVHSRNIRTLESKPISIPAASLSRTIGYRATTATSGMPTSAATPSFQSRSYPLARAQASTQDPTTHRATSKR